MGFRKHVRITGSIGEERLGRDLVKLFKEKAY